MVYCHCERLVPTVRSHRLHRELFEDILLMSDKNAALNCLFRQIGETQPLGEPSLILFPSSFTFCHSIGPYRGYLKTKLPD